MADRVRPLTAALGLVLVVLGSWQVLASTDELREVTTTAGRAPLTLLLPVVDEPVPGVVVAHGFAGSRQLMRSFGLALAEAGYAVALPDLPGHGAHPDPIVLDGDDGLAAAVAAAADVLRDRPEVDPGRLALLGHSMGSGAVLEAGIAAGDDVAGVVAVSPTDAEVTATAPRNLYLLAGEFEPRFVANAQDLLTRAGGPSDDVAAGTARALDVVGGVEHVGILFRAETHRASAAWLDRVTGRGSSVPTVTLLWWWLANLVGVVLLWRSAVPLLVTSRLRLGDARPSFAGGASASPLPGPGDRRRPLLGVAAGGLVATLVLAGLGVVVELGELGGMLVGPALALWFAIAGSVWLALGERPGSPEARDLGWGLLAVLVIVAAFGLLAPRVWLPWWPVGRRLGYVPVFVVLVLPFSLAFGATLQGCRRARALGRWVLTTAAVVVALGAAAVVVSGLGFLVLLLPLLPAILALVTLVGHPIQRPWAAGVAGAAFLGWTVAVLFPLA